MTALTIDRADLAPVILLPVCAGAPAEYRCDTVQPDGTLCGGDLTAFVDLICDTCRATPGGRCPNRRAHRVRYVHVDTCSACRDITGPCPDRDQHRACADPGPQRCGHYGCRGLHSLPSGPCPTDLDAEGCCGCCHGDD